jgi:hypothetical protein
MDCGLPLSTRWKHGRGSENRDATVFAAKTGGVPIFMGMALPYVTVCGMGMLQRSAIRKARFLKSS